MNIRRGSAFNLLGRAVPLIIALIVIPIYLRAIGEARYGVLAIVWLFTGYFGVFDLGLARASAFHLSRQHQETVQTRATTFWTALWLNIGLGIIGAGVVYFVAGAVFSNFFHMPEALRKNVLDSLLWIAAALPLTTMSGVLMGAMEAREQFGYMNVVSVLNNAGTQLVPLLVALFISPSLLWLIPSVVLTRIVGLGVLFAVVWKILPITFPPAFHRARARELLSYGGWISVSNMVAPILVTIDRILIGAMLSAQAVTYYTVPFNLAARLSIVPTALTTSLFPRFSRVESADGLELAGRGLTVLLAVTTVLAVTGIMCLPWFLQWWISPGFAEKAATVGIVLLFGTWVNGLAYVPYSLLQGQNKPDVTAKLHLVELPFFLLGLVAGIHWFGLLGAALAWMLRVTVDGFLMFLFARLSLPLRKMAVATAMIGLAVIIEPDTLLSLRSGAALALVLISIIWAISISPQLRVIGKSLVSATWRTLHKSLR